jgi:hypothetical protein
MATQLAELPSDPNNPIVFFDIHMGGHNIGRLKMELFANVCPKTAENFRYFSSTKSYITAISFTMQHYHVTPHSCYITCAQYATTRIQAHWFAAEARSTTQHYAVYTQVSTGITTH